MYDIRLSAIIGNEQEIIRQARRIVSDKSIVIGGPNVRNFVQPLGRIRGELGEFEKSLAASNARVVAFGASAGGIFLLTSALKGAVKASIEVEQQLSQIGVIMGRSIQSMTGFGNELFNIANKLGQPFGEATKAALELSRQGLGVEESLKRTSAALLLVRSSGQAGDEAIQTITAALNSFGDEALNATRLVNQIVAVDQKFAVSAKDISQAISRFGSTAADAGLSIEQLIGLVTAAQQTTQRGGAIIGNALKSIFTRLERPKVLDSLEGIGIAVKDTEGNIRPLLDVVTDLAKRFDSLSDAEQAHIAELTGGVYQINILKSILRDSGKEASTFAQAMRVAANATDEAEQRSDELNKTLSSQLTRTMNNLLRTGASFGQLAFGPSIKKILNTVESSTDGAGGEGIGSKIGNSLIAGFGKMLSGPGLSFLTLTVAQLGKRLLSFIDDAIVQVSGLQNARRNNAEIEKQIYGWLNKEKEVMAGLLDGTTSVTKAQALFTRELQEQLSLMKGISVFSSQMAQAMSRAGFIGGQEGAPSGIISRVTPKAEGHIPEMMERAGAIAGGYTPGNIKRMTLEGKPIVYNDREQVVPIRRILPSATGDSAFIIPPHGSPARHKYDKQLSRKGINPDIFRAGGHIPHLALDEELTPEQLGNLTKRAPKNIDIRPFNQSDREKTPFVRYLLHEPVAGVLPFGEIEGHVHGLTPERSEALRQALTEVYPQLVHRVSKALYDIPEVARPFNLEENRESIGTILGHLFQHATESALGVPPSNLAKDIPKGQKTQNEANVLRAFLETQHLKSGVIREEGVELKSTVSEARDKLRKGQAAEGKFQERYTKAYPRNPWGSRNDWLKKAFRNMDQKLGEDFWTMNIDDRWALVQPEFKRIKDTDLEARRAKKAANASFGYIPNLAGIPMMQVDTFNRYRTSHFDPGYKIKQAPIIDFPRDEQKARERHREYKNSFKDWNFPEPKSALETRSSDVFMNLESMGYIPMAQGFVPNLASDETVNKVFAAASRLPNGAEVIKKLNEGRGIPDAKFIMAASKLGVPLGGTAPESNRRPTQAAGNGMWTWEDLVRNSFGEDYLNRMGGKFGGRSRAQENEHTEATRGLSKNEETNLGFLQGLFKRKLPSVADLETSTPGDTLTELREEAKAGRGSNQFDLPHADFLKFIRKDFIHNPPAYDFKKKGSSLWHGVMAARFGLEDDLGVRSANDRKENDLGYYFAKRFQRYEKRGHFAHGFIPNLAPDLFAGYMDPFASMIEKTGHVRAREYTGRSSYSGPIPKLNAGSMDEFGLVYASTDPKIAQWFAQDGEVTPEAKEKFGMKPGAVFHIPHPKNSPLTDRFAKLTQEEVDMFNVDLPKYKWLEPGHTVAEAARRLFAHSPENDKKGFRWVLDSLGMGGMTEGKSIAFNRSSLPIGSIAHDFRHKSGGYVPNLASTMVSDAMQREMAAGYSPSQVKLGFDSRVGPLVYNTTEGDAKNAVNMHLGTGKSISQIRKLGSPKAAGYVPNLAEEGAGLDIATGGMLFMSQMIMGHSGGYKAKQLNKLEAEIQKAVLEQQEANKTAAQVGTLEQQILESKKRLQALTEETQHDQIRRGKAFTISFAAPLVGGIVENLGQGLGTNSQKATKAFAGLADSVSLASQVIYAIPGPMGLAAGTVIGGLTLASKTFHALGDRGPALDRELTRQQEAFEQSSNSVGNFIQVFDKLTDSYKTQKASGETIARLHTEYARALAEVPEEYRLQVSAASSSADAQKIMTEVLQKKAAELASTNVASELTKRIDSSKGILFDTSVFNNTAKGKDELKTYAGRTLSTAIKPQEFSQRIAGANIGSPDDFIKVIQAARDAGEITGTLAETLVDFGDRAKGLSGIMDHGAENLDAFAKQMQKTAQATADSMRNIVLLTEIRKEQGRQDSVFKRNSEEAARSIAALSDSIRTLSSLGVTFGNARATLRDQGRRDISTHQIDLTESALGKFSQGTSDSTRGRVEDALGLARVQFEGANKGNEINTDAVNKLFDTFREGLGSITSRSGGIENEITRNPGEERQVTVALQSLSNLREQLRNASPEKAFDKLQQFARDNNNLLGTQFKELEVKNDNIIAELIQNRATFDQNLREQIRVTIEGNKINEAARHFTDSQKVFGGGQGYLNPAAFKEGMVQLQKGLSVLTSPNPELTKGRGAFDFLKGLQGVFGDKLGGAGLTSLREVAAQGRGREISSNANSIADQLLASSAKAPFGSVERFGLIGASQEVRKIGEPAEAQRTAKEQIQFEIPLSALPRTVAEQLSVLKDIYSLLQGDFKNTLKEGATATSTIQNFRPEQLNPAIAARREQITQLEGRQKNIREASNINGSVTQLTNEEIIASKNPNIETILTGFLTKGDTVNLLRAIAVNTADPGRKSRAQDLIGKVQSFGVDKLEDVMKDGVLANEKSASVLSTLLAISRSGSSHSVHDHYLEALLEKELPDLGKRVGGQNVPASATQGSIDLQPSLWGKIAGKALSAAVVGGLAAGAALLIGSRTGRALTSAGFRTVGESATALYRGKALPSPVKLFQEAQEGLKDTFSIKEAANKGINYLRPTTGIPPARSVDPRYFQQSAREQLLPSNAFREAFPTFAQAPSKVAQAARGTGRFLRGAGETAIDTARLVGSDLGEFATSHFQAVAQSPTIQKAGFFGRGLADEAADLVGTPARAIGRGAVRAGQFAAEIPPFVGRQLGKLGNSQFSRTARLLGGGLVDEAADLVGTPARAIGRGAQAVGRTALDTASLVGQDISEFVGERARAIGQPIRRVAGKVGSVFGNLREELRAPEGLGFGSGFKEFGSSVRNTVSNLIPQRAPAAPEAESVLPRYLRTYGGAVNPNLTTGAFFAPSAHEVNQPFNVGELGSIGFGKTAPEGLSFGPETPAASATPNKPRKTIYNKTVTDDFQSRGVTLRDKIATQRKIVEQAEFSSRMAQAQAARSQAIVAPTGQASNLKLTGQPPTHQQELGQYLKQNPNEAEGIAKTFGEDQGRFINVDNPSAPNEPHLLDKIRKATQRQFNGNTTPQLPKPLAEATFQDLIDLGIVQKGPGSEIQHLSYEHSSKTLQANVEKLAAVPNTPTPAPAAPSPSTDAIKKNAQRQATAQQAQERANAQRARLDALESERQQLILEHHAVRERGLEQRAAEPTEIQSGINNDLDKYTETVTGGRSREDFLKDTGQGTTAREQYVPDKEAGNNPSRPKGNFIDPVATTPTEQLRNYREAGLTRPTIGERVQGFVDKRAILKKPLDYVKTFGERHPRIGDPTTLLKGLGAGAINLAGNAAADYAFHKLGIENETARDVTSSAIDYATFGAAYAAPGFAVKKSAEIIGARDESDEALTQTSQIGSQAPNRVAKLGKLYQASQIAQKQGFGNSKVGAAIKKEQHNNEIYNLLGEYKTVLSSQQTLNEEKPSHNPLAALGEVITAEPLQQAFERKTVGQDRERIEKLLAAKKVSVPADINAIGTLQKDYAPNGKIYSDTINTLTSGARAANAPNELDKAAAPFRSAYGLDPAALASSQKKYGDSAAGIPQRSAFLLLNQKLKRGEITNQTPGELALYTQLGRQYVDPDFSAIDAKGNINKKAGSGKAFDAFFKDYSKDYAGLPGQTFQPAKSATAFPKQEPFDLNVGGFTKRYPGGVDFGARQQQLQDAQRRVEFGGGTVFARSDSEQVEGTQYTYKDLRRLNRQQQAVFTGQGYDPRQNQTYPNQDARQRGYDIYANEVKRRQKEGFAAAGQEVDPNKPSAASPEARAESPKQLEGLVQAMKATFNDDFIKRWAQSVTESLGSKDGSQGKVEVFVNPVDVKVSGGLKNEGASEGLTPEAEDELINKILRAVGLPDKQRPPTAGSDK